MKAAFPEVQRITYEGSGSKNPLSFKHYNAKEIVEGKAMREHLRFSVAYWHSFRNGNSDPFGAPTRLMPWDDGSSSIENAQNRVRAAFEFMEKLTVPYYCFHDRDVAPEADTLAQTNRNLDAVVVTMKEEQQRTGVKLLWGTANLFRIHDTCMGSDQLQCRYFLICCRPGCQGHGSN